MVVDTPCGIDCPLEVSIPLMLVELELERFHGCYDTSVSRLNKFSPSLISPVWKTGALRFTFVILIIVLRFGLFGCPVGLRGRPHRWAIQSAVTRRSGGWVC